MNATASKETSKQPQSLQERLAEKSIKTMEKATEQQTMQRLQSGQAPQDILNGLLASVNQVASQKVPVAGTQIGIIPALGQAMQGKGFKPFAPQTKALGYDNALQLMSLQNNMQAENRRAEKDERQKPLDQTKLLQQISGLAKTPFGRQLLQAQGVQIPEPKGDFSRNPYTGDLTEKGYREQQKTKRLESQTTQDQLQGIDAQIQNLQGIAELIKGEPSGVFMGNLMGLAGDVSGGKLNTTGQLAKQFTPAFSAGIYKNLTNDRQISNSDAAKRAEPLIPKQSEDPKLQSLKTDFLVEVMQRRKQALQRGEAGSVDFRSLIKEFKDRIVSSKKGHAHGFKNRIDQISKSTGAKITYEE